MKRGKKRGDRTRVATGAAAAVAVLAVAGCSSSRSTSGRPALTPSGTPTPSTFALRAHQPVAVRLPAGSAEILVTGTSSLDAAAVTRPKPASGTLVVLTLDLSGVTGAFPLDPARLALRTPGGKLVTPLDARTVDAMVAIHPLAAGDLRAGETRDGDVVFDTAPLTAAGTLLFTDGRGKALGEVPVTPY